MVMKAEEIIRKTRNHEILTRAEIDFLIQGFVSGEVEDYQMSAWAMAVYFQGLTMQETTDLTMAMAGSGDMVDLRGIGRDVIDKHSTGGVGDKTTLIVLPLVAALGLPVAKMSGRGLGHTGGTIDKLEAIDGFQTDLSLEDFITQVKQIGAAVVAQTGNLVPADKKMYRLRDVTATVDALPLIASSVMSKKLAAGAAGIVLDVKTGSGAFMTSLDQAVELAEWMVKIGQGAGRKVVALITDMSQPLGNMVGNALEIKEVLDTLKGKGPDDTTALSRLLAAEMLVLGDVYQDFKQAEIALDEALQSGAAYHQFIRMLEAQGGKIMESAVDYGLPQAKYKTEIISAQEGYVLALDALSVGRAASWLGAGRARIEDKVDPAAGIELVKKRGDHVCAGEVLAWLYYNQAADLSRAQEIMQAAYKIADEPPEEYPLIYQIIR